MADHGGLSIVGTQLAAMATIEIENAVSELFHQERGVRQGSVLSPTLFLMVMNEMLKEMSANGAGVSIAGLYLGSAAHADDIRSLSQTILATKSQAATLVNFTTNNGLPINACKTEVVALSMSNHTPNLTLLAAGHQVGTKQEAMEVSLVLVEI